MKRVISDREEILERDQLRLLQQLQMTGLKPAKLDFLILLYSERLIVFGEPFIEPRRNLRFAEGCIQQRVNLLVKDRSERIPVLAIGRERNVINLLSGLEIARDPLVSLAVASFGFIRPVRAGTLEDNHVRRDRACQPSVRKDRPERRSKLLEFRRDKPRIFLTRITDDGEVRSLDPDPVVFRRYLGRRRRKQDRAKYGKEWAIDLQL